MYEETDGYAGELVCTPTNNFIEEGSGAACVCQHYWYPLDVPADSDAVTGSKLRLFQDHGENGGAINSATQEGIRG